MDGFNIGGAELKLLEMLRHMDRERYAITLCSFMETGDLRSQFEALGDPLVIMARKWRFDPSIFVKLFRLIRKGHFDIIQTLLFYPDIIGTVMARFCKVPVCIAWETASHYDTFFHPFHRRLFYRLFMRWATRIVTVSQEAKHSIIDVERLPAEQIDVIPYGIDLERYGREAGAEIQVEGYENEAAFVMGVVARLDYIKGHPFLLEALHHVRKIYSNFICLLIGDGEYRAHLEGLVQKYNLQQHVKFLGFRDDIPSILNRLDLFILPSLSEGLPNVILEAMAAQVPVIASAVGGIPEIIENSENGILVPPKNAVALAEAIEQVLHDAALREKMALAGKVMVEKRFSLAKQMERFESLYTQASIHAERLG